MSAGPAQHTQCVTPLWLLGRVSSDSNCLVACSCSRSDCYVRFRSQCSMPLMLKFSYCRIAGFTDHADTYVQHEAANFLNKQQQRLIGSLQGIVHACILWQPQDTGCQMLSDTMIPACCFSYCQNAQDQWHNKPGLNSSQGWLF